MASVAADPESSAAWLSLLLPGQGLVLSRLNSQHVTVTGAWAEIGRGEAGGGGEQRRNAGFPDSSSATPPSCALGQSPPVSVVLSLPSGW